MSQRGFLTIAQQVAAHPREELRRGRWTGEMPGRHEVTAELGVSDQTAETGLAQLEKEGILVAQGPGRRRRIEPPAIAKETRRLIDLGHRRICCRASKFVIFRLAEWRPNYCLFRRSRAREGQ